ncbi:MAG: sugar nucleotide-binding protein [Bacteroidota bacterium]|nr:sugar nucleotide-binding protein [Bacteroidota bacterium]MDP4233647.1 sugar nucleotide-binding protein [Bacteroidota bacterium]MDP4243093.1 sugar nucleotide-binding protein [Bacteroidota bacterium]MDP4288461.1 sugar nucleotide-binding protein [Bacteroidota bacterium]
MQKLLILGRGQIGSALAQALSEFEIHVWPNDIDELSQEAIETIAPEAIINAAGKTDLAWCEANANEAVRSNMEAPIRLYERILAHNRDRSDRIRFIQFSSGCVWDGPYNDRGEPFGPYDPPTPACLYSWTKAAADAMLLSIDANQVAVLRARQVYSSASDARNTLVKLSRYPRLIDTPNSMTSMTTIEKMVRHVLMNEDWAGIWNVYDRGVVTPFEVGEMLFEAGLCSRPGHLSKEELDQFHHPKRVDVVLFDARFEAVVNPPKAHDELERAINHLSPILA